LNCFRGLCAPELFLREGYLFLFVPTVIETMVRIRFYSILKTNTPAKLPSPEFLVTDYWLLITDYYSPAALRNASALSVLSHVNSGNSRPK